MAAFLRACWSLGPVQSRYIFEGEGSDQFLGRVASGLPLDSIEFCVLPPRFKPAFLVTLNDVWRSYIPHLDVFSRGMKNTLPFLFASLAYHSDWLRENLNPRHPLFRTSAWSSGFIAAAKQHVIVGNHRCDISNIRASGIPPFMVLARQIYDLSTKMIDTCQKIDSSSTAIMTKFSEAISNLPRSVGDYVLSNCEVSGAVPVSADHVKRMFAEMHASLLSEIRTGLAAASANGGASGQQSQTPDATASNNAMTTIELDGRLWTVFIWGSKFRPVPSGFRLERMNVKAFWDLWFFGDVDKRIRPYKYIHKDDLIFAGDKTKLSKGRMVITTIFKSAVRLNAVNPDRNVSVLPLAEANHVFSVGFNDIISHLDETQQTALGTRRYGELAYTYVYKLIKKY